ncbi:35492_t:CDS:2 [Gigaspora margarita]|uniref:35492_t:CDS:1 n=1 Tax=Gigaspora margarita TaxID=4874 RepID=A0ABN7VTJ0_GIGMA|nr:35492_t:CDS:2 [Gigaspora margarita]
METLEHITTCPALEAAWKRIEALIEETAWNSLISDAKYKVEPDQEFDKAKCGE